MEHAPPSFSSETQEELEKMHDAAEDPVSKSWAALNRGNRFSGRFLSRFEGYRKVLEECEANVAYLREREIK